VYLAPVGHQNVGTVRRSQRAQGRLLGRSAELDAVRERLVRGRAGRCEVVLIEGEPGIGKTRFLAEVLADPAGVRRFHADAEELERTRPFGPLADALGCRVSSADPLCVEIARLIDEGAAEFRIVERFADLLERTALEGPLLIAVDDFQWADPSTVTSLRFAARHLVDVPVTIVLASRPIPRGHELEHFVDTSIRDGALHVTLGPLDDNAVFELVEGLVGRPPGPGLRSLVASAAGNPFYVTELVEALAADGRLQTADGMVDADAASMPVAFRGAVVRYLRFLGESQLALLRWAAVVGSRFSPVDLATVSGSPLDSVLAVLEEAVRAGIVIHDGERLAFRHDLLREALYEDMGMAVRQSLHLQAGRALAAAGGAPLEVAHHLVRGPAAQDDMAVDWLVAAARQAIHLGTKADLLGSALERVAATGRRSAEIGAKAIVIMGQTGRVADAESVAERLRLSLDDHDAALLSAALAEAYAHLSDPVGVLRHCDAVRDHASLPARDRSMLPANEGFGLLLAGRVVEAEAAARRAIEAGDRSRTTGAIHAGRRLLCLCALSSGRGRDAAALAAETAESWPSDYGQVVLQMALLNEDRLNEAEALFGAAHHRILEGGHLTAQAMLQATSGRGLLLAGRLDDALAQAESALALGEQAQLSAVASEARGVIARVALHRGSIAEAEATLGPVPALPGLGVDLVEWDRALALENRGDPAEARQVLSLAWDLFTPLRYLISWISLTPDLVRLHVAAGGRDLAASVAAAVELGASGSDAPSATGAALRCRALVEKDPALVRQAIASYELGPRVLETASAREDAASLIGGMEAIDQLRAALAAYEAAGATADATRVRASLRSRGVRVGVRGTRQRPATGWDSLTPTERRIVAHAAEGLTSRQIGERLYISSFTVGSHLRHVYQKLGINSRLQLAAEMRHHAGEPG
jgi:DNA-binding CsgD family transcriptional regulator/tetratricopeptide (TPR) repeat protein